VRGRNFIEFGFGKARCIFNGTYEMNATVTDPTTLYCDTPPLDSQTGDTWYNVSVSLDGEYRSSASAKFAYYDQLTLNSLSPWLGPLDGKTEVTLQGNGFKQKNVCDLKVRFG